ncbi:MAG: alpha/beta hydrolase [Coriobacteriales bacterium]|jgi:pimeloyl-ACP methyl ester carboxylesterase|nr:alpha/beta hydrolase [Coriobacteriales bacterium]
MAIRKVQGVSVNVLELNAGGGDPLVMVHGLFTSLAVYALTIAPPLAAQHRVVLYDLRGHGLSERRDEGYTPAVLAQDLLDLMDDLEIPHAGIVGYSYGGAVALYTALHHPERVERLALIDGMLLEDNGARETHSGTDAGRRGRRSLRDNGVDEVDTREGEAVAEDASVPALSDEVIKDYTASTGIPVTEANLERLRSIARHFLEPERYQAALRANQQLFDELSHQGLTIPALLLYGKQSPYLDRGRTLASCIPSAKMRVIKGDHNLPVLQGERITRSFRNFFDPAQRGRRRKGIL